VKPSYDPLAIEKRWSAAWDHAGCHRAPDLPVGPKFYNYDSGPFPNGPLHLGHVRTYVLGDVTARFERLRGKCVLYVTEWDSFGLPNELEALREGVSPRRFTTGWIGKMKHQLRALGISYDWNRVSDTSKPAYYGRTQALFLQLLEQGLVQRRETDVTWCDRCETTLAQAQSEGGRCWRCDEATTLRRLPQWFVVTSGHAELLAGGLDRLEGWSSQARGSVRDLMDAPSARANPAHEWLVSRQRRWGTPIPIVHCEACGSVPVPRAELPVLLFDRLDGAASLVACPGCGRDARRETDTFDCFFDDVWCFLAPLLSSDPREGFHSSRVDAWMPVDRFHSGFDTVAYLPLHRFLGAALRASGDLLDAEMIRGHFGHAMVRASGHKMSKHLGNAVSPSSILRHEGADALRVGMLWASAPGKPVDWRAELVGRAVVWLSAIHRLYARFAESSRTTTDPTDTTRETASKAARSLQHRVRQLIADAGRFIEEYRPNAAIDALAVSFRDIETFLASRLENGRLGKADRVACGESLSDLAIALSPFAPHLAEELWQMLGHTPFVALARWPNHRSKMTEPSRAPLRRREPREEPCLIHDSPQRSLLPP